MTYARRVPVKSTADMVWWWNVVRDIWSVATMARFFVSQLLNLSW